MQMGPNLRTHRLPATPSLHVQPKTDFRPLSPVHTSNNVESTFDFVEATFDFVAKNGNNVERVYRNISSFRQSRMLLRHCCRFGQLCCRSWQQCRTSFSLNFVLLTKSKQTEHVQFNQFVTTLSKGRNFVRHCCQNGNTVAQTATILKQHSTLSKESFDNVA